MAAAGDLREPCQEAPCPLCLDHYTDPVTIVECGHNFCQACLTRYWGEEQSAAGACAQERSYIPNRYLRNVLEMARKLRLWGPARARERLCHKHQEPLQLFCKDHQAPICLGCQASQEHQSHQVVPREEACQEYKDQISSRLKTLRTEREKILTYKADAEKESQDLLSQTEEERQKTLAEFQQIHHFLEEQEKSLVAQIGLVEKEIARRRDEHLARLSRELSSLENVIQEMEEKSQQPASEFLQDVTRALQRSEKKQAFENPVVFPPELTCRIREFCDVKPILEAVKEHFTVVGAPSKPLLLYRADANQLTLDASTFDSLQPVTKPDDGPMSCFGAGLSVSDSVVQPAFGSSPTQAPSGGSSPLHAKSSTPQPALGETTTTFPFGTATTSEASAFEATIHTTSSDTGAVFGGSAPFQFTFRAPSQPVAANGAMCLSAAMGRSAGGPAVGFNFGSGQDGTWGASPFGSSLAEPPLGSQNQGTHFTFSIPGTTPEGKPSFGAAPTSTFGQGLPAPGGGIAGGSPSIGIHITETFGGAGSIFGSATPPFCTGTGSEIRSRTFKQLQALKNNNCRK